MPGRSIASLSLSFGLVSIPVKVYLATESAAAVTFKLMGTGGARLRQQYVSDEQVPAEPETAAAPTPGEAETPARVSSAGFKTKAREASSAPTTEPSAARPATASSTVATPAPPQVVQRSDMVRGYEFERGRFVLFTTAELEALAAQSRQTIDIVAFVPNASIDPVFYDKAYFLVPDKRGGKAYSLLLEALRATGHSALAKWAWRAKEYVVQVRATDEGLVLQQLFYADEVRSLRDLHPEIVPVGAPELALAKQIIERLAIDAYDPARFIDEEKQRILAAVQRKIDGRQVVSHDDAPASPHGGANVLDLMAELRASLATVATVAAAPAAAAAGSRKPMRRATTTAPPAAARKSARRAS